MAKQKFYRVFFRSLPRRLPCASPWFDTIEEARAFRRDHGESDDKIVSCEWEPDAEFGPLG
jgi:hypothetical protein